jgi:glucan phosphoethanolaminetransferase (alkaline phosphatase superfamily)
VPILLTGQFPGADEILPFSHLGLVEAFRLAGFHTLWLSAQEADGEITSFITAFSGNANERSFINGRVEHSEFRNPPMNDDGALLAPFIKAVGADHRKLFVVIHTLGSHFPYTKRYPSEFARWPVDAKAQREMWRWVPPFNQYQATQLDHAYRNTILYTDWVVDRVIAVLKRTGGISALVYLSDHGENDANAHAMPAGHAVLTPQVVNMPFFVWFSDEFRRRRDTLVQVVAANASKRVSAQDLFSTVCGLFQLQTSEADLSRNLTRPDYQEHERKVLLLDDGVAAATE